MESEMNSLAAQLHAEVHAGRMVGSEEYRASILALYREICQPKDEILAKLDHLQKKVENDEVPDEGQFLQKTKVTLDKWMALRKQYRPVTYFYEEDGKQQLPGMRCPLHAAAERGDEERVHRLLKMGHQVNESGDLNESVLCAAARSAKLSLVEFLISEGVDVNHTDNWGMTVMHHLARYGNAAREDDMVDIVSLLEAQDAYIFIDDIAHHTPLWYAIEHNLQDLFNELFEKINYERFPNKLDDLKAEGLVDMLNCACENDARGVINTILDGLNDEDSFVYRAFHEMETCESGVGGATVKGIPLLYHVSSCEYDKLAVHLLRRYPELATARNEKEKEQSSLFPAVCQQDLEMVYALMETGRWQKSVDGSSSVFQPAFSPRDTNSEGLSCLDMALQIGSSDLTAALYTTSPPPDMTRGEWLRSWYDNDRNIIKVCHDYQLFWDENADFTFALSEIVNETDYTTRMHITDRYNISYPEQLRPVGMAIILCNVSVTGREKRQCAHIDVHRLSRLLCTLRFRVEICMNLTGEEIKQKIAEVREHHLEHVEVFACIIMSHGGPGYVEGTDNERVYIDADVVTQFDANHCPRLKGKPKIFLVQACRGGLADAVEDEKRLTQKETVSLSRSRVHPKADMLIVFSTYDGHVAMTNPEHGAWFIEELVLTLELYSHLDHLLDIINKANYLLSKRQAYNTGGVQVAETRSSLRKKLYLFRTWPEPELCQQLQPTRKRVSETLESPDGKSSQQLQ